MNFIHQAYADYLSMSAATARLIADALRNKPTLVLCMASGHTPTETCKQLVDIVRQEEIDHSQMKFIGLDEWVGLKPDNQGSCRYYFENMLFKPLGLGDDQCYLFDGMSNQLDEECKKMDKVIGQGGIDLMVVGIGMNGHIGFNEPGTPFDSPCHVADLQETTIAVGQKYFNEATPLNKGITVGLGHLMKARQLILIANGSSKKAVIQKALHGPIDPSFPASIVQQHPNVLVFTDREAGDEMGEGR